MRLGSRIPGPLAIALAAVLAGCAAVGPGVTASRSDQNPGGIFDDDPTGATVPRDYAVIEGVVDFGEDGPRHPDYDGYLTAALKDIQDFWADAYPEAYNSQWTPLAGTVYAAYPSRQDPIPACTRGNVGTSTYEQIRAGTAFYCPFGDFMAYDDDDRLPVMVDQLGREAVAVALAHEFGHAVQARAGEFDQPIVLLEQQADCFAGAWVAHVASGGSDLIAFDDRAVSAGLIAMITVADPILTDGTNPLATANAHGTGFDRVGAFQDGFLGGVTRCTTFFTENRAANLIDLAFEPDDPNGGNLPLVDPGPIDADTGPVDIVTLIPAGLDQYWTALLAANDVSFTPPTFTPFSADGELPSCSAVDPASWPRSIVYCPDDNTIYWDQDYAAALANDQGDMAVGYLMSNAYSEAVQTALASLQAGEPRALLDACLTGVWVAWTIPKVEGRKLYLSAGDLDEAVITAIILSDPTTDTNVHGSAFEAVDAFRTGVLGGLQECQTKIL